MGMSLCGRPNRRNNVGGTRWSGLSFGRAPEDGRSQNRGTWDRSPWIPEGQRALAGWPSAFLFLAAQAEASFAVCTLLSGVPFDTG